MHVRIEITKMCLISWNKIQRYQTVHSMHSILKNCNIRQIEGNFIALEIDKPQ